MTNRARQRLKTARPKGQRTVADRQRTANKFKDKFDPNGSYTGTPLDGDKPTQDADDL
jgi:hypothetical protein